MLLLALAAPAAAEKRVALVVGNSKYRHVAPLRNPGQDAAAVAETLRKLDFAVLVAVDQDKITMEETVKTFIRSLNGADVALFYYSGHAVETGEQNHLLPVDSNFSSAAEMVLQSYPLRDLYRLMEGPDASATRTRLMFLDACRDNPFPDGVAGAGPTAVATGNVLHVSADRASLIGFSTSPGTVALDGAGRLSPYTTSFVKRLIEPRAEIRQVMSKVRADVLEATRNKQLPWDSSSLLSDFYFLPPRPPPLFQKLTMLNLMGRPDGGALPLRLPAPHQPEGGRVSITIESAPRFGVLLSGTGARPIAGPLTPEEFATLVYRAGKPGSVADAFAFTVEDAWGNRENGFVSLTIEPTPQAQASPGPKTPDFGRVEVSGQSILGLHPNLQLAGKAFQVLRGSDSWWRLVSAPESGQLLSGPRQLSDGRGIKASDLPGLTFLPAMGSAGRDSEAVFVAEAPATGQIRLRIRTEMHACDRLAGHRFDLQGVSDGVLPYDLDAKLARPACEAAVRDYPRTGRFRHQLGRALLAQGRNREAFEAFTAAAQLGHVRAQTVLGTFAMLGLYVPRDYVKARSEFEAAAARGDALATHALGVMHRDGFGVPKDAVKARTQFEASAAIGHTNSMNALGELYSLGTGAQKDDRLAKLYWEASAERRDIFGLNNLGLVYLNGIGTEKDLPRALAYFRQAAERGHPEAPGNLGRMYAGGLGTQRNQAEAVKWYRLGSARGDAWAALNLGEVYRVGQGVRQDAVEAARYFARAAALPQVEAAEIGRTALGDTPEPVKQALLSRLVRALDPAAARLAPAQMLARGAALAAQRGAFPNGSSLDDVLIALAKADWLSSGSRIDTL